ncbi:MAG TPA: MCE family protein, partial [Nocardioides sp.]|nr:MCE family protein [Nocardioides sp.]
KVNDVTVGKVTKVERKGYLAEVTMDIRNDTDLPANATANIRQTSLLGEKFVSLDAPLTGDTGHLASGANIPVSRTGRNPEVEEVLGALSLVLNGGGIGRLKIITSELNQALAGREDSARSVLTQVAQLMTQLNGRKQQIVAAITSVNRLAIEARKNMGSIDQALAKLPSAVDSLNRQRADLRKMLQALARLGNVGVRVIKATKVSTIDSLRMLDPVLTQVSSAGKDFVNSFSTFLTYPFIDESVGRDPQVARNLHMGDYVNLSINLDLDLNNLSLPDLVCIPINGLPSNESLDQLINLKNLCAGVQQTLSQCKLSQPSACAQLPQALIKNLCLDGGISLPLLCSKVAKAGSGTSSGSGSGTTSVQQLLHSLGLARPAPMTRQQRRDEVRWKAFTQEYDVDMLQLMSAPLNATGATR